MGNMNRRAKVLMTATELARHLDGGRAGHDSGRALAAERARRARRLRAGSHTGRGVRVARGRAHRSHGRPDGDAIRCRRDASVEAAARRWGVRQGVPVVVYDDWNRAGSARAWWVLTAAGLPDVRILDGGLRAWTAAGGALETGTVVAEPGDVTVSHDDLYAGDRPTLTAKQAAAVGILLDARAPERFRGDVEPIDPVAGHIPGAKNVPSTSVLADDGGFLRRRRTHAVVHGAGVRASASTAGQGSPRR